MGFSVLISRALRSSSSSSSSSYLSASSFIRPIFSVSKPAFFSSQATEEDVTTASSVTTDSDVITASEAVKETYDKMHKSIMEIRTCPPNALLFSMIPNCANVEDIKLLFDILQKLRVFRLANLKIHENYNIELCRTITKACIKAGAIDYAEKLLSKRNIYGFTPTIGSVHELLLHAEKNKNAKLAAKIMELVKKHDLPLQPGAADILFRICYEAGDWDLITKYGERFVLSGVKLRKPTFDIWMRFAAKRGNVDWLWKIEKFRSDSGKEHSFGSVFSCAKGFILERKPENAAAIIQEFNQSLSAEKRPLVIPQLQQLVSEWPLDVVKHRKKYKKELAAALQEDIAAMVELLPTKGLKVKMEDLTKS